MITISDVAAYCGVNVSTVSRVLNGNKNISEQTAQKVFAAVEELGYKPIRKKKKKKKTDELTLVMPNPTLYTLGTTVKEMALTLYEMDYDIRIVNLHHVREITPEIAEDLCRKDTAGIILYGCVIPEETAAVFYKEKMPVVSQQGHTKDLVSVCVNNHNGMRDAVEYVLSRGYKEVGFVGWTPDDFNIKERLNSFRLVMNEAGLDFSQTAFDPLNMEGGYAATMKIIRKYHPEAIVYAADILAYGGIKFLKEQGLAYPADIGIIGFDDANMNDILGLTSMYQLLDECARLVIEDLIWMIENKTVSPPKEILLTPRLVVRESLR